MLFNEKVAATCFRKKAPKEEASRSVLYIRQHLKLAGRLMRVDETYIKVAKAC